MVSRIEFSRNPELTVKRVPSDAQHIGKLKSLDVYWHEPDSDEGDVYVTRQDERNRKRIVALLQFGKFPGKPAWQVDMASVNPQYQGHGIVPMIYRFLMLNIPGFILQAGSTQSRGGRAIWNVLANFKDIVVYTMKGKEAIELGSDPLSGEVSGEEDGITVYGDYDDNKTQVYATKR